mmetsp:Transcript_107510/g.302601  ORF Transcript_107510/g.302601 Transcript_107510/m.302601 type:complete len:584 (-) Transcript_107510:133-1884(-)
MAHGSVARVGHLGGVAGRRYATSIVGLSTAGLYARVSAGSFASHLQFASLASSGWRRSLSRISPFVAPWESRLIGTALANCSDVREGIPVVILSGFLGAGKTTLLKHILDDDHGLRIGIIVNDLAAVNVDARVLETAAQKADARSIELANGCVCCTASDDLRQSILELASERNGSGSEPALDAIIVELSGVAEPRATRTVLDGLANPPAHIAQSIALVDSASFADDFAREVQTPRGRGGTLDGAERITALLAEQIEDADIVVLNKADVATPDELSQAEAVVKGLNPRAEVRVAEHGRTDVQSFFLAPLVSRRCVSSVAAAWATSQHNDRDSACGHGHSPDREDHRHVHQSASRSYDHSHGHRHGHSHSDGQECGDTRCTDPTHDHRSSAERRFGIRSFVYTAARPFDRFRLMKELQRWQEAWLNMGKKLELREESVFFFGAGSPSLAAAHASEVSPFASVLRSKGFAWLSTQPEHAVHWSQAGRCFQFSPWGSWGDAGLMSMSSRAAARGSDASVIADWPPRTEVIFIGAGIDEAVVRSALDACVLTEDEMANSQRIAKYVAFASSAHDAIRTGEGGKGRRAA